MPIDVLKRPRFYAFATELRKRNGKFKSHINVTVLLQLARANSTLANHSHYN